MKIKLFPVIMLCLLGMTMFSQSDLNQYKYVIVPKKFDFLNEPNQYRLNELTQFLFNKYGFEAVLEGEDYPEDLILNRCLALRSDVLKDSGLFKTKLNVELKDCNDRIVFTSLTGESREKEFAKAYNDAIRNAFSSFEAVNYKYEPSKAMVATTNAQPKAKDQQVTQEIEQLKAEIASLKKEKEVDVETEETAVVEESKPEEVKEFVAAKMPVESIIVKPQVVAEQKKDLESVLYAQPINNGYQLVDSTPKVVYKLNSSSLKDVFFVDGKQAIVFKKGDIWVMEYYEGETLKQETLPIKF